jgi:hypothetical protein
MGKEHVETCWVGRGVCRHVSNVWRSVCGHVKEAGEPIGVYQIGGRALRTVSEGGKVCRDISNAWGVYVDMLVRWGSLW